MGVRVLASSCLCGCLSGNLGVELIERGLGLVHGFLRLALLVVSLFLGGGKRLLGARELVLHVDELVEIIGVGALDSADVLVGREEIREILGRKEQTHETRGVLLHLVDGAHRHRGAVALLGEEGGDLVDLCLRLVDLGLELVDLGRRLVIGHGRLVDLGLELID